MRTSKSRSRGKRANNSRSTGNIMNRVFDSSGPEGKVRGTPQQIIEKYSQLHRDAQLSNDLVAAENFQQHAEHYARMLTEAQREQEAKREITDNSFQASKEGSEEAHVRENSDKTEKVITENDKVTKQPSISNNSTSNGFQRKERHKSDSLLSTENSEGNQSEIEDKVNEPQEDDASRLIAR